MKVLLLGAHGMLGNSIKRAFSTMSEFDLVTAARSVSDYNFDFLQDAELSDCFAQVKPDVVINAGAVVNLNICEAKPDLAYMVNGRLPGKLAGLCEQYNSYFIHISTDHYYTGSGRKKHDENADVIVCNEYARSKLVGEKLALLYDKSLVLRTNIVGFKQGSFLEWCLNSIEQKASITLFDDFFTSSMFTDELSIILRDLLKLRVTGLLNVASSTVSSKLEFVTSLANTVFGYLPKYQVGRVNDLLGVKRADSLGLDVSRAESILGYKMPDLEKVLFDIKYSYTNRS